MPDDTQIQDFRNVRVDQVGSLAPPSKIRALPSDDSKMLKSAGRTSLLSRMMRFAKSYRVKKQSAFRSSRTESFAVRTFKKASGQPSRASMLRTKTRQWRV
jgi:hypothetical protein